MPEHFVTEAHYDLQPRHANGYADREEEFRGFARSLLRMMEGHVRKGRLLDVGCSIGTLVDEANRAGYQAQGIDLDSAAVSYGQRIGRPVFRNSLEDWVEKDYDVVCLQHTLEHIAMPEQFLRACAKRLRADGQIVVVVPCHTGLHPRVFGGRWYGWVPTQHFYHYSPRGLRRVFELAGFRVERLWQNSMDHGLRLEQLVSTKAAIRTFADCTIAAIGGMIGCGDQLVAIGRAIKRDEVK